MPRHAPLANVLLPDFSSDESVLVGVSGGRDSMALLHWLKEHGFCKIVVCHLDHGLRAESRADARFVADFAKTLCAQCEVARSNVAALAKRRKISIEAAAREARYKFFARMARKHSCPHLFLAHHADDQVETFLFNLLRGSGSAGLGGMSPHSLRDDGLVVLRPLLGVWREEIDAYIAAHALPFREDGSNTDPRYTRNRIRHAALPALEAALGRELRNSCALKMSTFPQRLNCKTSQRNSTTPRFVCFRSHSSVASSTHGCVRAECATLALTRWKLFAVY